jgi:hypothetical protein
MTCVSTTSVGEKLSTDLRSRIPISVGTGLFSQGGPGGTPPASSWTISSSCLSGSVKRSLHQPSESKSGARKAVEETTLHSLT